MLASDGVKRCSLCKTHKQVSDFGANRCNSDGLALWCRICTAARGRQAYWARPEHMRESKALWNRNNPIRHKAATARATMLVRHREAGNAGAARATRDQLADALLAFVESEGIAPTGYADLLPSIHLDHVIPMSRGGPSTIDNLRWTYGKSNMEKRATTPEIFAERRIREILAMGSEHARQIANELLRRIA